ncbi:MAG: steryl acetyl hydrolase [Ruminococcaceae bacterium]|nr:steryl acetyl hydrolase [Oscillospiraceae bacterium]
MNPSYDFIHLALSIMKRFGRSDKLTISRRGINRLGKLAFKSLAENIKSEDVSVGSIPCCLITPNDVISSGVILYLHGGGYVLGDLDYAKGFSARLAVKCSTSVFCVGYRLAPEYPFPAALEDALDAYGHLLSSGYDASQIILCGESAGGGLCYSLCYKLKEKGWPLPAGIIVNSPWTDLNCNSESYILNKEKDLFITSDQLQFYSESYTNNKDLNNPLISPIMGKMDGFPASLIFVGSDEILLDDSVKLHELLETSGCESKLTISPGKWHAYLLFGLKEDEVDFELISKFIRKKIPGKKKLKWMSLDNAAKIFPAARRRNWSNVFRLSATLNEVIDRDIMQSALDVTVRRFPSIAVRVKTGFFWYYLEEIRQAPEIIDEKPYPLSKMPFDDIRKCAFRVIVYNKRVAVEFFHAVTDGNGGLIFLKTLVAEYVYQKYGFKIPSTDGIFNRLEEPTTEELEDSFQKNCGPKAASRKDSDSFRIMGKREVDGFKTNTTFILDSQNVVNEAKRLGVSVTAYLSAAFIIAANRIQEKRVRNPKKYKPVKVTVPVNLRNIFSSKTVRNFALYANIGIDPALGSYEFEEICALLQYEMKLKITSKNMAALIQTNVGSEKPILLRLTPLFIKNIVMKSIFNAVGEKKGCFSFSNLGVVKVPEEFYNYVERMDFVLGVQANAPYNISSITYKEKLYLNIIRNINEPVFEKELSKVFNEIKLPYRVESNSRED